jgi:tetratricopeptide (TPR) repeat protein
LLELVIIFSLGLALFLLLRHYPEAKGIAALLGKIKFKNPMSGMRKTSHRALKSIEEEIAKNNPQIIAPIEIENAVSNYKEKNPELARLLHLADEAFLASDLREAEAKCLEVLANNKKSVQAYVIMGKIAFSRGEFDDAKSAFKTAIKCDAEAGEAYFYLGKIDLKGENFTGAIEYLQKSIFSEKGHADWYAELGKAYMEVRQYAKAAKVLKRATSLDIDSKEYRDLAADAEEKQRTHALYSRFSK